MIEFPPSAAKAARRFIKGAETPVAGLRLFVSGGGCLDLPRLRQVIFALSPRS